jgi:hypothetical protein
MENDEVKLQQIPINMLGVHSIPHAKYALKTSAQSVIPTSEYANIKTLVMAQIPQQVQGCIVTDVLVSQNEIQVNVTGSPFTWSALLLALPQILLIGGIAIGLVAVYFIVGSVPLWAYGLGAISMFLLFVLPKLQPQYRVQTQFPILPAL